MALAIIICCAGAFVDAKTQALDDSGRSSADDPYPWIHSESILPSPHADFRRVPLATNDVPLLRPAPDCGIYALYVLLHLHRIDVEIDELKRQIPLSNDGATMLQLKNAARAAGLTTDVLERSPLLLDNQHVPVVALLAVTPDLPGHYVVVCSADESNVELIDGTTLEAVSVSRHWFHRAYSGYCLAARGQSSGIRRSVLFWICLGVCLLVLSFMIVWRGARANLRTPNSPSL